MGAGHAFEMLWLCHVVPFLYCGCAGWNGIWRCLGLQIEPREFRFTHRDNDRTADCFDVFGCSALAAFKIKALNKT
jgi:hypothetical protein